METFICSRCDKGRQDNTFGGTGYGLDSDGNKICYDCCAAEGRSYMLSQGATMNRAYIKMNRKMLEYYKFITLAGPPEDCFKYNELVVVDRGAIRGRMKIRHDAERTSRDGGTICCVVSFQTENTPIPAAARKRIPGLRPKNGHIPYADASEVEPYIKEESHRCDKCGIEVEHEKYVRRTLPGGTSAATVCFHCSDRIDIDNTASRNSVRLYLADFFNGVTYIIPRFATFAILPYKTVVGKHNITGKRLDVWFIGPDNAKWHGVQYGNGNCCHCTKLKN